MHNQVEQLYKFIGVGAGKLKYRLAPPSFWPVKSTVVIGGIFSAYLNKIFCSLLIHRVFGSVMQATTYIHVLCTRHILLGLYWPVGRFYLKEAPVYQISIVYTKIGHLSA